MRRNDCFIQKFSLVFLYLFPFTFVMAQEAFPVGEGWAKNSVNTVVFRKNSLTSFKDTQFIAYYNAAGYVMLGKRHINSKQWQLQQTRYKGNVADAHNSISIAVDGKGYLHLAWDHHNTRLRYCKSVRPGALELTDEMQMTGTQESKLSYPEFYNLPNGDLLFFYRDGSSGSGNLVINRYDVQTKTWKQVQQNLIDGESKRNAYWQACVDAMGGVHLSWVWRESPDVASNHDVCYAYSPDGGSSWQTSGGEFYQLPIKAVTAEYACYIPQGSELINQTSVTITKDGMPVIASYWRDSTTAVPQYHLVYKSANRWQVQSLDFRNTDFSLKGSGTKRIPISRPQVISWKEYKATCIGLVFRDEERDNKVSIAVNKNLVSSKWKLFDLTTQPVGSWEPSYDISLWKQKQVLHLFVQKTEQADAEGTSGLAPQKVSVLQWKPKLK